MEPTTGPVRAEIGAAQQLMSRLQERIGTQKFNAWFRHGTRLSVEDKHVRLTVPNPFVANWIETHYYPEIAAAVETHVSEVLRKLQLTNRSELTRWAVDRGLG